jgi:antitoxin MazE
MQVAKWGNSLAVRLPVDVVRALGLAEGDEIQLKVSADAGFEVARDPAIEEARAAIRSLRGRLPADFTFDRDEANAR